MSSILAMCCYDTLENQRSDYTRKAFDSLLETVDFKKHRLGIFNNASCDETEDIILKFEKKFYKHFPKKNLIIRHSEVNIGTGRGINQIWALRSLNENAGKIDNDISIHQKEWVDTIETAFEYDNSFGIIALKRNDLIESVNNESEFYRSELVQLPYEHQRGQKWITLEVVNHALGTCQIYGAEFLKVFGYLFQPSKLYAFDDSLAGHRAKVLGYKSAFLCNVEIDHLDTAQAVDYIKFKQDHAGEWMDAYNEMVRKIYAGELSAYYDIKNDAL